MTGGPPWLAGGQVSIYIYTRTYGIPRGDWRAAARKGTWVLCSSRRCVDPSFGGAQRKAAVYPSASGRGLGQRLGEVLRRTTDAVAQTS